MQRLSSIAQINIETGINRSGNRTVTIGDISLRPVYHLIEHTNKGTQLRLIPLFEAARSIINGDTIFNLSSGFQQKIMRLYHEHHKYFYQKGIKFI
jgi:hypothetical protein